MRLKVVWSGRGTTVYGIDANGDVYECGLLRSILHWGTRRISMIKDNGEVIVSDHDGKRIVVFDNDDDRPHTAESLDPEDGSYPPDPPDELPLYLSDLPWDRVPVGRVPKTVRLWPEIADVNVRKPEES